MSGDSRAAAVLADLDRVLGWQADFYRDLHAHPELSHQEQRTASLVAKRLRQCDYRIHEGLGGTGVVGILRNGKGPTVLLRADMDALPVREATGLPYASTVTTGGTPVMHACGHDMHVTCLLGAAELLATTTAHWNGTVIALFQPAEEVADGARGMVDDGLAAILPRPDIALAQHVLPLRAGRVATNTGPTLAAADSMRITVYGRGAHGSMPQSAIDPVVLAAMIVVRLQTVVAREVSPEEAAVLTVGSIQAGTKSNIIPDRAEIQLNIRTYSDSTSAPTANRPAAPCSTRSTASFAPNARHRTRRRNPTSNSSNGSPSPTTTAKPPIGSRRPSPASSVTMRATSAGGPPARTSATSRTPSASRTPTGASAARTRSCSTAPNGPAASPRTSRPTTRRPSLP